MTRSLAEILLIGFLAMNASLLIFIAGVLRKVMNDMDESAFKAFVDSLVRHSKKSAFMITVLDIPFIGAIPYCFFYGFANRWLIAGLALWLIAGCIAKAIKFPIYKTVASIQAGDGLLGLREARRKLNAANLFQAVSNSAAALLPLVPFVR
jgi:VIT1/CCC1 family predicted Fe2+/Mn2+ transporter